MSNIREFLRAAKRDEPVFISDVRAAFARGASRPFHCHVALCDGSTRAFRLALPPFADGEEAEFAASYVHATLYNILSALGAVHVDVYCDRADAQTAHLAAGLNAAFQTALPPAARGGYGKCLNVNERMLAALCGAGTRFAFRPLDIAEEPPVADAAHSPAPAETVFAALPARAQGKMLLGVDVGGTDVKLAVSIDGRLEILKEYDWFPAAFERAEQLLEPLLLLARLLRAAASLVRAGRQSGIPAEALKREATLARMREAAEAMEAAAGDSLRGFDAIGLCFPDVVIRDRVVGGETYKTRGMRENTALDYEEQFAKITGLNELLRRYAAPGGAVRLTNDGPMAAFATAVEVAAAGGDVSRGFFAHTLGTELGSGWVKPDGSIPEIPLEVYNFIIDLGSFGQRGLGVDDARSIDNFNTGLSGTLQKYTSQAGAFRLAAKRLPAEDPALWKELLARGLFRWDEGALVVPTEPVDLRKPCLELLMERAEDADSPCAEIFRQIGEALAVTWLETSRILRPECAQRTLFGRLVKSPATFALLCEGASRVAPRMRQSAADGALANTPLMRQLAAHARFSVAQFAQAVGALYYGCLGL